MICEVCSKSHNGRYGSGRFCSASCARSYSSKKASNKTKIVKCFNCKKPLTVGLKSVNKLFCDECKKTMKYSDSIEEKICPICNNFFYIPKEYPKTYCSRECHNKREDYKEIQRQHAFKNKFGGHTSKNSIHYKTQDGNIVYLQSSYEVTVANILDDNNIQWNRPKPFIWIDAMNIKHRYYPDFYLQEYDIYLDPKNDFLITEHKEKIDLVINQNNINLVILSKKDLNWNNIRKLLSSCNSIA